MKRPMDIKRPSRINISPDDIPKPVSREFSNSGMFDGWFNYEGLYKYIIDSIPKNGTFIEIGVLQGASLKFAADYAKSINKKIKFYGIDIFGDGESWEIMNRPDTISVYEIVQKTFEEYENVTLYQGYSNSPEILNKFEEAKADAVFIDADHGFEACYQDIINYYPLIKKGGIVSGHDYFLDGVRKAIDKFLKENNRNDLFLYKNQVKYPEATSWFFIK